MTERLVYLSGEFVVESEARISIFDAAVLSLIHISEPTDQRGSRMPSSA